MIWRCVAGLVAVFVWTGCVSTRPLEENAAVRPFRFPDDTFAYANELQWEYIFDASTGRMKTQRRIEPPKYTLHCFTMTHRARQFFERARFAPTSGRIDDRGLAGLLDDVFGPADARRQRITIPGYSSLREFSRENERLLKAACGGRWRSYFQRGNWRMIFPFTRSHQKSQAEALVESLRRGRLPIIHLVRFPQLTINHAMLVYQFRPAADGFEFLAYDPNDPDQEARLQYENSTQTFCLPRNRYFAGGRVDVYEIYRGLFY